MYGVDESMNYKSWQASVRGGSASATPPGVAAVPASIVTLFVAGWASSLLVAMYVCRGLYGDGAYALLQLLQHPARYIDYDAHRSFASFLTQTPILVAQRLGATRVSTYAASYTLGAHALPAALLLVALTLGRRLPVLFAATSAAIVVFGFGANFVNTEANLFLALAWLAAVILALPDVRPLLRGLLLPLVAFALLRVYEGMLLAGPVLAGSAWLSLRDTRDMQEKIGLTFALFCFVLAALIGFSSVVAPRDPANAAGFGATAWSYFRDPQVFMLASSLFGLAAVTARDKTVRGASLAAVCACAAAFAASMTSQRGYYAYALYYYNRSFLVLLLPFASAGLLAVRRMRPAWLAAPMSRTAIVAIVVPFAVVIAIDLLGSLRWYRYMTAFCAVLEQPASNGRIAILKRSGAVTGWGWTHPALSILLRRRGSVDVVHNEPGQWQPFDPDLPVAFPYTGACENRRFIDSATSRLQQ